MQKGGNIPCQNKEIKLMQISQRIEHCDWLIKNIRTNQSVAIFLIGPFEVVCKMGLVCVELHFWTVLETNFDPVTVKFFVSTVLIQGNFVQFQAFLPAFVCFSKSSNNYEG